MGQDELTFYFDKQLIDIVISILYLSLMVNKYIFDMRIIDKHIGLDDG